MTLASYPRPFDALAPVPTTDLARYFAARYTLDRVAAGFGRVAPCVDAPALAGVGSVPPAHGWAAAWGAVDRLLPYGCGVALPSDAAVLVACCELDVLRRQCVAYLGALEHLVGARPAQLAEVSYGRALLSCRELLRQIGEALDTIGGLA